MNNSIYVKSEPSEFFECQCEHSEHTLRFTYDPEYNELYTEIFLSQYLAWYKRVWAAIKYIFGYKCRGGHFDGWMMNPEDAKRLRNVLEKVE